MDSHSPTSCSSAPSDCAANNYTPDSFTFLSLNEVLAGSGVGKTSWYALVRKGEAPAPVKVTGKRVAWIKSEVLEYRARLIAARKLGGA